MIRVKNLVFAPRLAMVLAIALSVAMICDRGARAQIASTSTPGGPGVPAVGIFCMDSSGHAVVCNFGSGSTSGAVSGAFGSFVDGWNVTVGSLADAAWNGSASSATQMAVQKAIYGKLAATLAVSVTSYVPFSGSSSRFVIATGSSPNIAIAAAARNSLAYQLSGATTDYACAVWAASTPTFTITNSGAAVDCGLPGAFLIAGQSSYSTVNPNAPAQALFVQAIGTISDTFGLSAQW